ncbi:MAG: lipopolysaccharide export system ATP-binding protein, partial [Polaromonas sp.]
MTQPTLTVQEGSVGLKVRSLRKSYKRRPVIRDVSLELGRGEAVALLGPNGSGKTTCFYAIAGLVTPEGGVVEIDGRDATLLPMYRRAKLGIGYLPQEMSIFRGLSVEDNILAILEITIKDRSRRRDRLETLLSEFSIGHLRRAPALALSGGERRRVEIARCLAAEPKYLLLDEPFAGVDPIAVAEIRGLVADLKTRGIGVLITDH